MAGQLRGDIRQRCPRAGHARLSRGSTRPPHGPDDPGTCRRRISHSGSASKSRCRRQKRSRMAFWITVHASGRCSPAARFSVGRLWSPQAISDPSKNGCARDDSSASDVESVRTAQVRPFVRTRQVREWRAIREIGVGPSRHLPAPTASKSAIRYIEICASNAENVTKFAENAEKRRSYDFLSISAPAIEARIAGCDDPHRLLPEISIKRVPREFLHRSGKHVLASGAPNRRRPLFISSQRGLSATAEDPVQESSAEDCFLSK